MGARLPTGGFNVENWAAPQGASYFALTVTNFWTQKHGNYTFLILQWETNGYYIFCRKKIQTSTPAVVESNVQLQLEWDVHSYSIILV